jgi:hypothetical protein
MNKYARGAKEAHLGYEKILATVPGMQIVRKDENRRS